jgi:transposase-like protein
METMERKRPRPRRAFTSVFKADIVERCLAGDRSVNQVAARTFIEVEEPGQRNVSRTCELLEVWSPFLP